MSTFKVDTLETDTVAPSIADATKTVVLDADGATTGTSTTLDFNQTANRVITFPDASGTVVTSTGIQDGTVNTFTYTENPNTESIAFAMTFSSAPRVVASVRDYEALNPANPVFVGTSNVTASGFDAVVNVSGFTESAVTTVSSTAASPGSIVEIVNGNPAIAFANQTSANIYFVRATNATGSAWGSLVTVASYGTPPGSVRRVFLKVVSSNPAIIYLNGLATDIMYTRSSNVNGTSWTSPSPTVAVSASASTQTMEVVSSNPAIAYVAGVGVLEYVRATNTTGSSWGSPTTVVGGSVGTGNISLVIVNGNPAISYTDPTNDRARYVRATNTTGTSWGSPVTVASAPSISFGASMKIVSGNPAIVYVDSTNDLVMYVRATDASGTTWGTPVTVATSIDGEPTLAIIDGFPAVSTAINSGNLYYIRSNDTTGTSWGVTAKLIGVSSWGNNSNILVELSDNTPGIHYAQNITKYPIFTNFLDWSGYDIDYIATNV